MLKAIILPF